MIENDHSPAVPGGIEPTNDNAAGSRCLPVALVPLVRLLARQAVREWVKQAANDNRPEGPEAERPGKE